MRQIDGAVARIINRHRTNVLHFLFVFVVTIDEAFAVRINDVPVPRVRNDKAAFAASGLKPILPADDS